MFAVYIGAKFGGVGIPVCDNPKTFKTKREAIKYGQYLTNQGPGFSCGPDLDCFKVVNQKFRVVHEEYHKY